MKTFRSTFAPIALVTLIALSALGCRAADAPAPTADEASAPQMNAAALPSAGAQTAAEQSPFVIEGDVVRVNNSICAVSRSQMAPETLGQFVSRVTYDGSNAKFRGKTFEFNQCCGGCVEKFPTQWAKDPDAILAYHGVN